MTRLSLAVAIALTATTAGAQQTSSLTIICGPYAVAKHAATSHEESRLVSTTSHNGVKF